MCCESSDVVRFDLGPLLQGQTRIAKLKSAYNSLIVDHPTFTYFECLIVSIGSNAHSTLVACVYRPPGSCSNPFYDEFHTLVEFLSSMNSSFHHLW